MTNLAECIVSNPPMVGQQLAEPQGETVLLRVKLCNLPPFHAVANQLLALSAGQDPPDIRRVASIVSSDPALAAEVLFLANSSLFGFPARIRSLAHAVTILGAERIQDLALTVAMRTLALAAGPYVRPCWRHSVACAVIAHEIAHLFDCPLDHAYTAGLLHDVGRLGFLRSYAREVAPVLGAEYSDNREVLAAEVAAVNTDHGTAGSWLIEYWVLPELFGQVCAHHHDAPHPSDSPVLQTIQAACRLADAVGFGAVRYKSAPNYAETVRSLPSFMPRGSFPEEEELRAKVESRLKIFDC